VLAHRYAGLAMAGFLLVAGLTGALLAWYDELDAAANPALLRVRPPSPDAALLDPLALRERAEAVYPGARVSYAPLRTEPGRAASYFIERPLGPGGGAASTDNQLFLDPYTGALLGQRLWGDIGQGRKNLLPFVYRLHYALALGVFGSYLFGAIALLWTIDCFVGAYLSFPLRKPRPGAVARPPAARAGRAWLARWWPAWKVRWGGGATRLNFDLHRAGGLWPWALLLVVAWSSVSFNLTEVYNPVMRALLAHQPDERGLPRLGGERLVPVLSWRQARETGRRLMADAARARGFDILHEQGLQYDPATGVYGYSVRSSLDVRDRDGATSVYFDGDTGALRLCWLPTGAAAGDTVRQWITGLHMAAVWGWPFKVFMSMLGVAVAMLSGTGVLIWWKKRKGRAKAAAGLHPGSPPPRLPVVAWVPAGRELSPQGGVADSKLG
jgi:uncharacterized iron-regulated membrane protein